MTKVRPIIFSGAMVRSLLSGSKSQTRRVVATRHFREDHGEDAAGQCISAGWFPDLCLCPYGQPGDLLWLRENFAHRLDLDHRKPSDLRGETVFYWADGPGKCCRTGCNGAAGKTRPSIHMPRWASRLTLRITDVRVERLDDISTKDAAAEGIDDSSEAFDMGSHYQAAGSPMSAERYAFRDLWDSINAARGYGWDANPWVWALTFDVIHANVDEVLREAA